MVFQCKRLLLKLNIERKINKKYLNYLYIPDNIFIFFFFFISTLFFFFTIILFFFCTSILFFFPDIIFKNTTFRKRFKYIKISYAFSIMRKKDQRKFQKLILLPTFGIQQRILFV